MARTRKASAHPPVEPRTRVVGLGIVEEVMMLFVWFGIVEEAEMILKIDERESEALNGDLDMR